MSSEVKRNFGEVLTIYQLEPQLIDIYVEGISDKIFYERTLNSFGIIDFNIQEINTIDFSELYQDIPELRRNCKLKVKILSEKLFSNFTNTLKNVSCIIDKDFDDYLDISNDNFYLYTTDFSSVELYLFEPKTISDFYNTILHGFPFTVTKTISELKKVLVEVYLIRFALAKYMNLTKQEEIDFIDINRDCKVNKANGELLFNREVFLDKVLHKSGLFSHKNSIELLISKTRDILSHDDRNQIRGHDFIHLFFYYISKIKKCTKFDEETLSRVLFAFIDFNILHNYSLIQKLISKYQQ